MICWCISLCFEVLSVFLDGVQACAVWMPATVFSCHNFEESIDQGGGNWTTSKYSQDWLSWVMSEWHGNPWKYNSFWNKLWFLFETTLVSCIHSIVRQIMSIPKRSKLQLWLWSFAIVFRNSLNVFQVCSKSKWAYMILKTDAMAWEQPI